MTAVPAMGAPVAAAILAVPGQTEGEGRGDEQACRAPTFAWFPVLAL